MKNTMTYAEMMAELTRIANEYKALIKRSEERVARYKEMIAEYDTMIAELETE